MKKKSLIFGTNKYFMLRAWDEKMNNLQFGIK